MERRQAVVSLTGFVLAAICFVAEPVVAQPTEFVGCAINPPPWCTDTSEASFIDLSCPGRGWFLFSGRIAFEPLQYTGPIRVEVDSRGVNGGGFGLPLYVECLRVADHPPQLSFCDGVGTVIAQFMGHQECLDWEGANVDLGFMLDPGDSYVIRLHFVTSADRNIHSPYFACIRVAPIASSSPSTSVQSAVWGEVKALYKSP